MYSSGSCGIQVEVEFARSWRQMTTVNLTYSKKGGIMKALRNFCTKTLANIKQWIDKLTRKNDNDDWSNNPYAIT